MYLGQFCVSMFVKICFQGTSKKHSNQPMGWLCVPGGCLRGGVRCQTVCKTFCLQEPFGNRFPNGSCMRKLFGNSENQSCKQNLCFNILKSLAGTFCKSICKGFLHAHWIWKSFPMGTCLTARDGNPPTTLCPYICMWAYAFTHMFTHIHIHTYLEPCGSRRRNHACNVFENIFDAGCVFKLLRMCSFDIPTMVQTLWISLGHPGDYVHTYRYIL